MPGPKFKPGDRVRNKYLGGMLGTVMRPSIGSDFYVVVHWNGSQEHRHTPVSILEKVEGANADQG